MYSAVRLLLLFYLKILRAKYRIELREYFSSLETYSKKVRFLNVNNFTVEHLLIITKYVTIRYNHYKIIYPTKM